MKNKSTCSWCENGVCEIQMNRFSVTNAGGDWRYLLESYVSINNVEHSDEVKMLASDTKKEVNQDSAACYHSPCLSISSILNMQMFAQTLTFECLSWHVGPTAEQHTPNEGEYTLCIWIEEQLYLPRSRITCTSFQLSFLPLSTLAVCVQTK